MGKLILDGKAEKFGGGMNTNLERVQLESGVFSTLKNVDHRPMRKRKGAVEHNTTGTTDDRIESLFQFSKARRTEIRLFAQIWDNSGSNWPVIELTDNPPSTGTSIGTERMAGITGVVRPSWAVLTDIMLYADKARQGKYFTGERSTLRRVMYYNQGSAPNISPDSAEDITAELRDDGNTLEASIILDAANDQLYIASQYKINRLYFNLGTSVNANVETLVVQYHNQSYLWATVANMDDDTLSGGATMAIDGGVSWDIADNDQPVWMFGQHAYWYKISATGLTDTIDIISITGERVLNSDDTPAFGTLQNVWDGLPITAVEAQVYRASTTGKEHAFSGDNIYIGNLDTSDYVYFNFPFPIYGLLIDVGNTPHKNLATVTPGLDCQFVANVNDDTLDYVIIHTEQDWISLGFEPGMDVAVTVTTTGGNAGTFNVHSISGRTMFFRGNTLAASESGKAGTKFEYTAAVDLTNATTTFEAYNDVGGWTGLGTVTIDGTNGLTESGLVLWDEKVVNFSEKPFSDSQYSSYWYRMHVNERLTRSVNIGIQGLIYPIGDQNVGQIATVEDGMQSTFGLARTVASWKDRAVWSFDFLPHYVYISARLGFNVLNGLDFGVIRVGDGRSNAILRTIQFYNELFVFQEEKGPKGGCVTVIEGDRPAEYGTLVMSDEVGIMNAECAAMVDGVSIARSTGKGFSEERQKLLFWLSRKGVFVTDGQVIYQIDAEIANYFDPRKTNSIRRGYEERHSLTHDKQRNKIVIDLVTGASATAPNTTLCYDLVEGRWSEDTPAQPFACRANVQAASGDIPVLQIAGGTADGKVYQVNQTDDDVSTAIDMDIVMELDMEGKRAIFEKAVLRFKRESSGNISWSVARNGSTTFGNSRTISMTNAVGTDTYIRENWNVGAILGDHFSLRIRNNESGKPVTLHDLGLRISEVETHGAAAD